MHAQKCLSCNGTAQEKSRAHNGTVLSVTVCEACHGKGYIELIHNKRIDNPRHIGLCKMNLNEDYYDK